MNEKDRKNMLILNFAHPLTPEQRQQIEQLTSISIEEVRDIPVHIDQEQALIPQVIELVNEIALDLMVVAEPLPRAGAVSMRPHQTITDFQFHGEPTVKILHSWIAGCYRNPDVVRALTKRGHVLHSYPAA